MNILKVDEIIILIKEDPERVNARALLMYIKIQDQNQHLEQDCIMSLR
jgi:hypothetical protein